ncbi:MAG: hypothetical protein RIS64_429 [Bacteroidota bacterium]
MAKQYKAALKADLLLTIDTAKVNQTPKRYNSQFDYYAGNQSHSTNLKKKKQKKIDFLALK